MPRVIERADFDRVFNAISRRGYKIFGPTVRAVGMVTRALSRLKAGAMVGLRGPFGSHWPLDLAVDGDVIIVAGGIGIAPLLPAVRGLLTQRQDYQRVALLYGARTPTFCI